MFSSLNQKGRATSDPYDERPSEDMDPEKAFTVLNVPAAKRSSTLTDLDRTLLDSCFMDLIHNRIKIASADNLYNVKTSERHVYEGDVINCSKQIATYKNDPVSALPRGLPVPG